MTSCLEINVHDKFIHDKLRIVNFIFSFKKIKNQNSTQLKQKIRDKCM